MQACSDEGCPDIDEESRTMLGEDQEAWFLSQTSSTHTQWNLVAQQVVMANFNISDALLNYDQWDGYPAARARILEHLHQLNLSNFLVCTGDIHIGGVARINADADDFARPIVAYEFVTPSVTSSAKELEANGALIEYALTSRENVEYIHATKRGYIRMEFDRERVEVLFRMLSTVAEPNGTIETEAVFSVDAQTFSLEKTWDLREE